RVTGFGVLIEKADAEVHQPPRTLWRPDRRGLDSRVQEPDRTGEVCAVTHRLVPASQQVAKGHLYVDQAASAVVAVRLLATGDCPDKVGGVAGAQIPLLQTEGEIGQCGRRGERRSGDGGCRFERLDGPTKCRVVTA